MDLTNSKRLAYKATYVATELSQADQQQVSRTTGRALQRLNHIRALQIGRDDLPKLQEAIGNVHDAQQHAALISILGAVTTLTGNPAPALQLASHFAPLNDAAMMSFSKLVEQVKGKNLDPLLAGYQQIQKVAPVGRLHLERVEMYPVGLEQGELMFTIPLAPSESCTVSHKEWSTTSQEYEDIVQDSFESYSERGVAEKTDASMSTESEAKHSLALSFGASVSGGPGPVTVSTTFGLNSSSEEQDSVKKSTQQSRELTEKASARTRKEHKVSLKLEAKKGVEDESFRTIANPYADRALRVDYYRMMRKWRTDLYRYSLRLTYDICIPNPGARFWAKYRQLADLDRQLRQPLTFSLQPTDITDDINSWPKLAAKYGAVLDPPPPRAQAFTVSKPLTNPSGGIESFEFTAPPGYSFGGKLSGGDTVIGKVALGYGDVSAVIFSADSESSNLQAGAPATMKVFNVQLHGAIFEANHATVFALYSAAVNGLGMVELEAVAKRDDALLADWQLKSWQTLHAAALDQYKQNLTLLQDQRDRLYTDLTNKDTLSLRRLEREELLRLVMDWLVGTSFTTAPDSVSTTIETILTREGLPTPPVLIHVPLPSPHDVMDTRTDLQYITDDQWADAHEFGVFVKFVHESVEWENMLFFVYPYFWGSEQLGKEKLLFEHPDPNHRDFLRAGYVRVVIPVRPGFETDFTTLVETGSFTGGGGSPYITFAEDVANFARTNYQGIPPANPEKHARPLLYPQQRTTWSTMETVIQALEAYKSVNNVYPPDLAALGGGPYHDAWGRDLVYIIPGSGNDYDLFSYGADGAPGGDDVNADISAAAGASFISTWFDYTPTSGLDIELTAKPAIVV
jgi:hypothetical protein